MLGGHAHTARNLTFANLVSIPYLTIVTLFTHFHDFAMHNIELVYYESGIQVKFYVENVLCKEDKIAEFETEECEKKYIDKVIECKQIDFDDFLLDEEWKRKEYQRTSFLRTKNSIYYLARSGCWDWFLTLTLSPDKVDRYNLVECSRKLRKWLNHFKERKCPDMYYLIVPEQHKDGAWHFHGLIGGCSNLSMVDSGHKDNGGSIIYNWSDYKLGFSTATAVKDTARVSSYICKYITKDICGSLGGRQRYFVSKNTPRAQKFVCDLNWRVKNKYFEWLCENSSHIKKVKNDFNEVWYFECDYFPLEMDAEEYPQPKENINYDKLCNEFKLFNLGFKPCPVDWDIL